MGTLPSGFANFSRIGTYVAVQSRNRFFPFSSCGCPDLCVFRMKENYSCICFRTTTHLCTAIALRLLRPPPNVLQRIFSSSPTHSQDSFPVLHCGQKRVRTIPAVCVFCVCHTVSWFILFLCREFESIIVSRISTLSDSYTHTHMPYVLVPHLIYFSNATTVAMAILHLQHISI